MRSPRSCWRARCRVPALDPAFGAHFRAEFLERRRAALATLVERANQRGDLPAALTAGFAADVVFGVLWYRLLAVGA